MTTSVTTLLLFDIDGTLIQTAGAGLRGMNAAFTRLYGTADALDGIPVAGRTDRAIAVDAFRRLGVDPTDDEVFAMREAYLEYLPGELMRPAEQPFGILPGVGALLESLARHRHLGVGLLTGNFEAAAAIKLGHFDLWRPFPFGAFGDSHVDRRDLVPIALACAEAVGIIVPPSQVVVIGDTPRDVDCAHAHGAVAVGVATGLYSATDLANAEADLVVRTLEACDGAGAWLDELMARRR